MKNVKISAIIAVLITGGASATTQFRTPISLWRGVIHYPLEYVGNAWWFDDMQTDDNPCKLWDMQFWAGGYARSADKAFVCKEKNCDDPCAKESFAFSDCDLPCDRSSKRAPLANLWFGKSSFTVDEAFAGGQLQKTITGPSYNPLLAVSRIAPRFDYFEKGVYFGLHGERKVGCSKNWHVGARMSLPFKVIEVQQDSNCKLQETLDDMVKEVCYDCGANPGPENSYDYAYRLDLLSAILRPAVPASNSRCLVEYGPIQGAGNPVLTKVGGQIIGGNAADFAQAYVVKSVDGSFPEATPVGDTGKFACGKTVDQVSGALPADGSGINGATYHFGGVDIDYKNNLAKDKDAQRTLFVVPRINIFPNNPPVDSAIVQNSIAVRNAVSNLLGGLAEIETALQFLCRECCIDLSRSERVAALGELYVESYFGYTQPDNKCFINWLLGAIFPTGTEFKDARRVYVQTTGENKHYQLTTGVEGGWHPCDWFGLKVDFIYNHVFGHKENKAAPFAGATIRNIGPNVEAYTSWGTYQMHADLNFFHPFNPDLGISLGYELFAKSDDRVRLCQSTAVDCLGNEHALDARILERCTNVLTHKIRGEIFHRWNYFELFAGASQIVAGRNAMQETEAHIGLMVYF